MIFFLLLFSCIFGARKTQTLIGKNIGSSSLAAGIESENSVLKSRSYSLLFQTASTEEFQFWWPKFLLADPEIQIDLLADILTTRPEKVLVLSVLANPSFSQGDRCKIHLIAARQNIPLPALVVDEIPTRMKDRLFCALLEEVQGNEVSGPSSLAELLQNETLPLDLDFYEALQASKVSTLSGVLAQAYHLSEEHYRIPLGSSWIILDPDETSDLREELLSGTEMERMELIDFFWSIESPTSESVLRKLSAYGDDAGSFAKLALLSQGQGSPRFALKILENHTAKEMKLASLKALGNFLRKEQSQSVEAAIIETFEVEEVELRIAAIQAAGIARMAEAWRPLKRLKPYTLAAKIEIEASLRAISLSQR